jgi:hypothetical protein
MALDISNNNVVRLTRGDTFTVPIFLNKGTALKPLRYVLKEGDEMYMAIMEPNEPFECAIVKKVFTKEHLNEFGDVLIELEPKDTECLVPGKYYYQVKAKFIKENNKEVINTVVPKTEFWIEE